MAQPTHLYYPLIDPLRALAACTVVMFHIIALLPWSGFPESPLLWQWFRKGWMGVDFFFVISGFVITHVCWELSAALPKAEYIRTFVRHRLARLMPLYLLTLLAALFTVQRDLLAAPDAAYHLAMHLLLLHAFDPETAGSLNGPNWTIAVEMQFYLLILFAIPFIKRWSYTRLIAVALAIAWGSKALLFLAIGGPPSPDYSVSGIDHLLFGFKQLPLLLDSFLWGVVAAKALHQGAPWFDPKRTPQGGKILAALAAGLLTATLLAFWRTDHAVLHPAFALAGRTLLALGFALTVALAVRWTLAREEIPLWLRPFCYLGKISYGIYLWHLPAILWLKQQNFVESSESFAILTFALVLILAAASWHLLERPLIRKFR